jgi:hypothetical protein
MNNAKLRMAGFSKNFTPTAYRGDSMIFLKKTLTPSLSQSMASSSYKILKLRNELQVNRVLRQIMISLSVIKHYGLTHRNLVLS